MLTASAGSASANQALRGVASTITAAQATTVEAGQAEAIAGLSKQVAALQARMSAAGSSTSPGSLPETQSNNGTPSVPQTTLPSVVVTDVVPRSSDDPTGGGLTAAAFPLVLGGILGGVLISLLVVEVGRRLLALVVYAIAAGALTTFVLHTVLHSSNETGSSTPPDSGSRCWRPRRSWSASTHCSVPSASVSGRYSAS